MSRLLTLIAVSLLAAPTSLSAQDLRANFDKFGNVVGEQFGLGRLNEFQGKRILVWSPEPEVQQNIFVDHNPLWAAIKKKGFAIEFATGQFDPARLANADQLWVFAGQSQGMDEAGIQAVVRFVDSGKGLYAAADNEPYLMDANALAQRLFRAQVTGYYDGGKTVAVRRGGMEQGGRKTSGKSPRTSAPEESVAAEIPNVPGRAARINALNNANHFVADHALLTDIDFIYEGITISHVTPSNQLQTVLTASDGQILAAVAADGKRRVVLDGGWTRYYVEYVTQTAGTIRYAENIAAYLAGKDRRAGPPKDPNDVLGYLDALAEEENAQRRAPLIAALEKASPTYASVKENLEDVLKHAGAEDRDVARLARVQVVNAFGRAPIGETLQWLGRADPQQAALIWECVDQRIARADSERKAGYRESALAVLADRSAAAGSQQAALELLTRLKDRQAVAPIIEQLPQMPRTLWPAAGETLGALTGQDFGPKPGDGVAEVVAAVKKWRTWLEENGAK
jgi:hypothetical protein